MTYIVGGQVVSPDHPSWPGLDAANLALGEAHNRESATASSWGALAYSESTGRPGYSWSFPDRARAEARALAECGSHDARILVWAHNHWIALTLSRSGAYHYAWHPSSAEAAAERALVGCRARDPSAWLEVLFHTLTG